MGAHKLKKTIKWIMTFIWHPIITVKLLAKGSRDFVILPQMTINNIKKLSVGNNFYLGRNSRFLIVSRYRGESYNPSIVIGNNVSIGNRFSVLSAEKIKIGDNALLASDILITTENHGMMNPDKVNGYADNPLIAKPVTIGNGCWIGEKVTILPGVELGEKCVVAAGAVVNQSFDAYSLLGGVPARIIKTYDKELRQWVTPNN